MVIRFCFFFQAEDGIRDLIVTGVQTCALPISLIFQFIGYGKIKIENVEVNVDRTTKVNAGLSSESVTIDEVMVKAEKPPVQKDRTYSASVVNSDEIGRASCRERV